MDIVMAAAGGNQGGGGGQNNMLREYRKGNWTVQETMVLIEGKKMDDERRTRRQGESGGERGKPAELRWKWVEDYCWRNGCMRSQNQCNDKWDNLMRDFKKVREHERKLSDKLLHHHHGGAGGTGDVQEQQEEKSYWNLEKNERKLKNLPSNMLPQIYQALLDVVEKKGQTQRNFIGPGSSGTAAVAGGKPGSTSDPIITTTLVQPSLPPSIPQYTIPAAAPVSVLPLPSPAQHPSFSQPFPIPAVGSDSDTSEHSDSPEKRSRSRRRRRRKRRIRREGSSSSSSSSGTNTHQQQPEEQEQEEEEVVGSAICKSAKIIAEAIQYCEEREERRHREMLNLHKRRLEIEETKTEINRQGINGLVDAVNKLANSILAFASHKTLSSSSTKQQQ